LPGETLAEPFPHLTPKQRAVGAKLHLQYKVIAYELGMTVHMVRSHVQELRRELGVNNRTAAALAFAALPPEARVVVVEPPRSSVSRLTEAEIAKIQAKRAAALARKGFGTTPDGRPLCAPHLGIGSTSAAGRR